MQIAVSSSKICGDPFWQYLGVTALPTGPCNVKTSDSVYVYSRLTSSLGMEHGKLWLAIGFLHYMCQEGSGGGGGVGPQEGQDRNWDEQHAYMLPMTMLMCRIFSIITFMVLNISM